MLSMNEIMQEATDENIRISRKRAILYWCLFGFLFLGSWIVVLVIGSIFPEAVGGIVLFNGLLFIIGLPITMVKALNYDATYDSLVNRKINYENHKLRLAAINSIS